MPSALTYPGVYIEEVPSGVRTITGVATSITAFLGGAPSGPVNEPVVVNSYGDFERRFGGLNAAYPMSYAVRDFYLNGGSQAVIVRLYNNPQNGSDGRATVALDDLALKASSPGVWGNDLRVSIDVEVLGEMRKTLKLDTSDPLFNLTVSLGDTRERFLNVTTADNARRIDRVLEAESSLVRFPWPGDDHVPTLPLTANAVAAKGALAGARNASPPVQAAINAAKDAYDDALAKLAAVAGGGDDGQPLDAATYMGSQDNKTGLYALEKADLFNLLCIVAGTRGGDVPAAVYQAAMAYCAQRRAMLLVDPPAAWGANKDTAAAAAIAGLSDLGLAGNAARNAALYFPRLRQADPLRNGQIDTFVPCGAVAGVMARTDTERGVWKAPAGLDAAVNGISGFDVKLNDGESGMLNPLGINCFRDFPVHGKVIWGARTLRGADQLADEYKYVPVRRTALYIEESLFRGTQWVVFEPNDEPLWAQIRLNVGAFMHSLFRMGAFQGQKPGDAYFVKCDGETTTQDDVNRGIVNVVVGFAPLKPAEFVVIKLQQIAGQIQA